MSLCLDIKGFTSTKELKVFLIKRFMSFIKKETNLLKKCKEFVKDSYLPPKFPEISKL